jgi:MoaA/NifB/PqqE/SkfB family radical SAM enzyme
MRIASPVRAFNDIFVRKSFLEAQLIVTRRCNLSCGYCTEYDNHSADVPLSALCDRIGALHRLGVAQIALLGGEPLLHKDIDKIVARARRRSQTSITTNGFPIRESVIHRLNAARLDHMQISIDTLSPRPDRYIQKSFKSIRPKLEMLLRHARFSVHANIVLCEESKNEFKETVAELRRLNIPVTVNLLHDETGKTIVSGAAYADLWEHHHRHSKVISFIEYEYGKELLTGATPDWHCRAGARHVYVDEYGNAQYCASQRGRLEKPILEYTRSDLEEQRRTRKGCERGCSVFCVYRASKVDNDFPAVAKAVIKSFRNHTVHLPFARQSKSRRVVDMPLEPGR